MEGAVGEDAGVRKGREKRDEGSGKRDEGRGREKWEVEEGRGTRKRDEGSLQVFYFVPQFMYCTF